MKALIVAGGTIDQELLKSYVKERDFDFLIGVDGGLRYFYEQQQTPTHIVGDFDSIESDILAYFQKDESITVLRFAPEKDETDMEIAIQLAVSLKSKHICIFGGTGTRIDHLLGNIQLLSIPLAKHIPCWLIDQNNRIRLLDDPIVLKKENQYGKYVSFLPLTSTVEGLTLKGFKYPLQSYCLESNNALTISNEIKDVEANISFETGILIMIESKD